MTTLGTDPECTYCNDTGMIAIRSRDGLYAFPGHVPDDAKGYADADCWYCDCAKQFRRKPGCRLSSPAGPDKG